MQNIRQSRLFDRALERSPDYVSFGLVILCGFLLARLTWSLFPAEPRIPGSADPSLPAEQSTPDVQDLGEMIAGYHLFGHYEPTKAEPVKEPVRNTQLALKLQGVYAAGKQGQAIIEEGGNQKAYSIGQAIGNSGAVLENVFTTYVELRHNGNLEKLELPKLTDGSAGNIAAGGMAAAPLDEEPELFEQNAQEPDIASNYEQLQQPDEPELMPDGALMQDDQIPEIPGMDDPAVNEPPDPDAEVDLNAFREEVMNNNMRLLDVISPQPYEANGKFVGFRLQPGRNVAMFNKIGFQPGDIVTAVNGTALDSPAAGMQALQSASTASSVTLSITRGGQQISLPISF